MARYILKEGFTHYEDGPPTPTPAGTIVKMSDKRFHSLRDRFELVSEPEGPSEVAQLPSEKAPETLSTEPDPLEDSEDEEEDYSDWVAEIASLDAKVAISTVAVIEELEVLVALLAVESRITVVSALEDRIEEIA